MQTGAVSIQGFEIEVTGQLTENLKIDRRLFLHAMREYDGRLTDAAGNQLESVP